MTKLIDDGSNSGRKAGLVQQKSKRTWKALTFTAPSGRIWDIVIKQVPIVTMQGLGSIDLVLKNPPATFEQTQNAFIEDLGEVFGNPAKKTFRNATAAPIAYRDIGERLHPSCTGTGIPEQLEQERAMRAKTPPWDKLEINPAQDFLDPSIMSISIRTDDDEHFTGYIADALQKMARIGQCQEVRREALPNAKLFDQMEPSKPKGLRGLG